MSVESQPVSAELLAYIAEKTWSEDRELARLRRESVAAGLPDISIGPVQARLLQILLASTGARRVVEVGTLGGYGALSMAAALPEEGRVDTIESDPGHADFAADWLARARDGGRVRLHRGHAAEVLPGFEEGSYDAMFIDADKGNYPIYLDEGLRLLRTGGLLLVDNAFAFGEVLEEQPSDPEAPAIQAFNELIASHPRVQPQILAVGDGMWIAVKRA